MEIARTISGNAPLAIKAAKITIAQSAEGSRQARHGRDQADRHRLHGLAKIFARAAAPSWKAQDRSSQGGSRRSGRDPIRRTIIPILDEPITQADRHIPAGYDAQPETPAAAVASSR